MNLIQGISVYCLLLDYLLWFLSKNNITSFDGFDGNKLQKLNLASNQFQAAPNLSRMEILEEVDLSKNEITTLDMAFIPQSVKKARTQLLKWTGVSSLSGHCPLDSPDSGLPKSKVPIKVDGPLWTWLLLRIVIRKARSKAITCVQQINWSFFFCIKHSIRRAQFNWK